MKKQKKNFERINLPTKITLYDGFKCLDSLIYISN